MNREERAPETIAEKLFMGALFSIIMGCIGVLIVLFYLIFGFIVCCKIVYEIGMFLIARLFGYEQKEKTGPKSFQRRSFRERRVPLRDVWPEGE